MNIMQQKCNIVCTVYGHYDVQDFKRPGQISHVHLAKRVVL